MNQAAIMMRLLAQGYVLQVRSAVNIFAINFSFNYVVFRMILINWYAHPWFGLMQRLSVLHSNMEHAVCHTACCE